MIVVFLANLAMNFVTIAKGNTGSSAIRQKWKLGQCRSISVRSKVREISYLSFRPPELGQPFWSFLLLVVAVQELKCLIPKSKLARNLTLPNSQNLSRKIQRVPSQKTRYEPALTKSTSLATEPITMPDEDWSQAETELMELVGGK